MMGWTVWRYGIVAILRNSGNDCLRSRQHDLLVTGGSDWHGKGKPNALGENLTDDDTVREIMRRGVDSGSRF